MNNIINKNISLNEKSCSMNKQEKKFIFKNLILTYLIKEIEKIEKEEGKISTK